MNKQELNHLHEKLDEILSKMEDQMEGFRAEVKELLPLPTLNKILRIAVEHLDCNLNRALPNVFCGEVMKEMSRVMEAEKKDVVDGFHILSNFQLLWFGTLSAILASEDMEFGALTEEQKDNQSMDDIPGDNLGIIEI
jgi:regulator of replication initiation timing